MILYASLVKSLNGLYYPIECESELEARLKMNCSDMASQWCSIYTEEQVDGFIKEYGGIKLPLQFTGIMCFDYHKVQEGWHLRRNRNP